MVELKNGFLIKIDKINEELIELYYKNSMFKEFAYDMCDFLNKEEDYHIGMFDNIEQINHYLKSMSEMKKLMEYIESIGGEENLQHSFIIDNHCEPIYFITDDEFLEYVKGIDYDGYEIELNKYLMEKLFPSK